MSNGEMIVSRERYDGLVMAVSPAEAKRRVQQLQAFVQEVMIGGVDFGVIPGTEKPSLYQPGAQKLAELYGFAHDFIDVVSVEDWEKPFFFYRRKCKLTSRRDDSPVGVGVGSCNSREDRYAWRWLFDNELPAGTDKKSLRTKSIHSKKNGRSYLKYALPNPDIFSLVNTIEKMACKRAYIHAVIAVTRSSGLFTQDVEDLPAEAYGEVSGDDRSSEPKEAAPPLPVSDPEVVKRAFADIAKATTKADMNAIAKATKAAYQEKRVTNDDYVRIVQAHAERGKQLSAERQSEPATAREPGEEG